MRRSRILCGLFALAATLVNLPAAAAHENATFVNELLTILNETRSPDAFLVTITVLSELKPDARQVVSTIIRNAERLKLFAQTDPERFSEQQRMILGCLEGLMKHARESVPAGAGTGVVGSGQADPLVSQSPRHLPEVSETDRLNEPQPGVVKASGYREPPGRLKAR